MKSGTTLDNSKNKATGFRGRRGASKGNPTPTASSLAQEISDLEALLKEMAASLYVLELLWSKAEPVDLDACWEGFYHA